MSVSEAANPTGAPRLATRVIALINYADRLNNEKVPEIGMHEMDAFSVHNCVPVRAICMRSRREFLIGRKRCSAT